MANIQSDENQLFAASIKICRKFVCGIIRCDCRNSKEENKIRQSLSDNEDLLMANHAVRHK